MQCLSVDYCLSATMEKRKRIQLKHQKLKYGTVRTVNSDASYIMTETSCRTLSHLKGVRGYIQIMYISLYAAFTMKTCRFEKYILVTLITDVDGRNGKGPLLPKKIAKGEWV